MSTSSTPPRSDAAGARAQLGRRLAHVPSGTLVTVVAAAGYGKTTLLEGWRGTSPVPSALISLDSRHNDPHQLGRQIVWSLSSVVPALEELRPGLGARSPEWVRTLLPRLGAHLAKSPTIPMFDDVHVLTDPAAQLLLETFVAQQLRGGVVVLSGRQVPRLHVGQRRAPTLTITESHLRLHTADVISASEGTIPTEVARSIVRMTWGWPAAVSLLMSLHRQGQSDTGLLTMSPADPRLVNYLDDEGFADLDPVLREVLAVTATTGPLDATTLLALLPDVDVPNALKQLVENRVPLVVVTPDAPQPITMHALARERLSEGMRRLDPQRWHDVLVRAGKRFEAQGMDKEALDRFRRTGDRRLVLEFVSDRGFELAMRGDTAIVRQWLAFFSPGEVVVAPRLLLISALTAAADCDFTGMEHWLALLLNATSQGAELPQGDATLMASALLEITGVVPAGPAVGAAANALQGPFASLAQIITAVCIGSAGLFDTALAVLEDCAAAAADYPLLAIQHMATTASILSRRDDFEAGMALVLAARRRVEEGELQHNLLSVTVDTVEAWFFTRSGDVDRGRAALKSSMSKLADLPDGLQLPKLCWISLLAEAALTLDDLPATLYLVEEADKLLPHFPEATAVAEALVKVRAAVAQRPLPTTGVLLTATELTVLEYLPSFWTVPRIASELLMSVPTARTHIQSIYRKMAVHDRDEAVAVARAHGLIGAGPPPSARV